MYSHLRMFPVQMWGNKFIQSSVTPNQIDFPENNVATPNKNIKSTSINFPSNNHNINVLAFNSTLRPRNL